MPTTEYVTDFALTVYELEREVRIAFRARHAYVRIRVNHLRTVGMMDLVPPEIIERHAAATDLTRPDVVAMINVGELRERLKQVSRADMRGVR